MLRFADDLRVYLHREPVDFRCGINTLAALVEESMRLDPLARVVYAFRNRKCDRIKLLLYERTGFWLLLRRRDAMTGPARWRSVRGCGIGISIRARICWTVSTLRDCTR